MRKFFVFLFWSAFILSGCITTRPSTPPLVIQKPSERPISPEKPAEKPSEKYHIPKIKEIMLDAGHGGKDPGAIGRSGVKEKFIVLDITMRLKKLLEQQGFKVTLTRSKDVFVSLKKRTEMASQTQADIFISIHANAHKVRSIHGLETYVLRPLNILEKNEAQRKNNHRLFFSTKAIKKGNQDVEAILKEKLYAHKQDASYILARKVARETSRHIRAKNLGVKPSRFFVLRNTLIPAILVEVGFLSNPREERLLKKSSYRQKIAEGLAKSIISYARE